eukprot:c21559_g1_i1 orf=167-1195(+)
MASLSPSLHPTRPCQKQLMSCIDKPLATLLKISAMPVILFGSFVGICVPILGKSHPAFAASSRLTFVLKSFAAGVVLATGFVHVLPDAFRSLDNDCLPENPWRKFPFAGFVSMVSALCALIVEFCATAFQRRRLLCNESFPKKEADAMGGTEGLSDVDMGDQEQPPHGQIEEVVNGSVTTAGLLRYRIISQVLELGIVIHSLIIGTAAGSSNKPCIIRPLIAALTFHQLFEGVALGGCIIQAQFNKRSTTSMIFFFSCTAPIGIGIGMAISSTYNESSRTAVIVDGVLNSLSAGILVYLGLVDLIASDFLGKRLLDDTILQIPAFLSLFLGMGATSFIAQWS